MNLNGVNMITCDNDNCYIIRGTDGDILIDTGTPKFRDEIETWLMEYDVRLIVLTHGHNDHIGNAAYFSEIYGAPVAMGACDFELAENNLLHKTYSVGAMGKVVSALSKKNMQKKSEPFDVSVFLEDGMKIGKELGADCVAVQLDGHTKGSFGILSGRDLYVGDAVMNLLHPIFPAMCESPKAARESIEKIKALSPERIFFGHGKPIEVGTKEYRRLFKI